MIFLREFKKRVSLYAFQNLFISFVCFAEVNTLSVWYQISKLLICTGIEEIRITKHHLFSSKIFDCKQMKKKGGKFLCRFSATLTLANQKYLSRIYNYRLRSVLCGNQFLINNTDHVKSIRVFGQNNIQFIVRVNGYLLLM